jgi:hypothetical protein
MKKNQFNLKESLGLTLIKGDGSAAHQHREQLTFRIDLTAELFNAEGELLTERRVHNTVTAAGLAGIMDQLLASPALGKATHMGIGSGSPGGSALGAEEARVAFSSKTRDAAVVTHVASFGAGVGTATITEAGIFDAASTGNMWMSSGFTGIPKGANDTLQITWTLTAS